jgi:RNA polymerase sigma-70 factor (ECF subfamily)
LAHTDLKGLFAANASALLDYLVRRVRDRHVAADLVQETFLRMAAQNAGTIVENPQAYLYRTANNLLIDHVRQERRRQTYPSTHEALADHVEDRPAPDVAVSDRERLGLLRQAVMELPLRTRQIFVLNRIDGRTYAEIARTLDISDSSVQKHLARALRHVMQRLKAE